MKESNVDLEEALDSTDWALIIGKDEEDDEVPAVIIDICKNHFGIDPTTEEDTLH
jgi:superfamily I DNA and RNA helicase